MATPRLSSNNYIVQFIAQFVSYCQPEGKLAYRTKSVAQMAKRLGVALMLKSTIKGNTAGDVYVFVKHRTMGRVIPARTEVKGDPVN